MLTEIRLHGDLGEKVGNLWKATISSVGQGMRAVEMNSKKKFYKYLIEKDREGVRYQVLINGREFEKGELNESEPETVLKSELSIINKNIKTIDIIPVIEGAGSNALGIITTILGVLLIIVGIVLAPAGIGVALIVAGIGLVAAGVLSLLSKPPKFESFNPPGKGGYLFNGPENTVGEGGPIPIIYGRLIVGSLAIGASYQILNIDYERGKYKQAELTNADWARLLTERFN